MENFAEKLKLQHVQLPVGWRLVTHSLSVVVCEPTHIFAVREPWKIPEENPIQNTNLCNRRIGFTVKNSTTKIYVLAKIYLTQSCSKS